RVRQAGDDREFAAEILENFEVRREWVILAVLPREEVGRVQAERCANADHPPPRLGVSGPGAGRGKQVETRQGQRHAGGAEEGTTGAFHRTRTSSLMMLRIADNALNAISR